MKGRIMAVDPGDKRLGLALSDLTATIASPYTVIDHQSRILDAAQIAQLASEQDVTVIVVGQPLNQDGSIGPAARKASRLADVIRTQTDIPVVLWDETGSTQTAKETALILGVSRRKRKGHLDEIAATVILQSYLEANR